MADVEKGAARAASDARALEKLSDYLDDLERFAFSPATARVLSRRGISASLFRSAIRGVRLILEGDAERAAQQLEALSSDLRDVTLNLEDEPR
jgi:uroporphyrinogen-III synthase